MASVSRIAVLFCLTALITGTSFAQSSLTIGANVNMVTGADFPNGDPFQRQQNEPSVAFSSRNSLHLLAGANDYRAVDVPGLPGGRETGDSWLSYFWSTNGGATWKSTLIPGYPQDPACLSANPPVLCDYAAGADPVVRAGVNGMFYYSGIVFERSDPSRSAIFVSRFIDLNNDEGGDPIRYIDTRIIDLNNDGSVFLDKSWIGVDIPRGNITDELSVQQRDGSTVVQEVACGNIYVGYAAIGGEGDNLRSEIRMATSVDCGNNWDIQLISAPDTLNQGANIAIHPLTGELHVVWRRFDTVESFLGISPTGCPASPASWEVNNDWPVSSIELGGVTYSIAQAQALLGTKHRGDESIKLAYEVIAAKLNLLTGGGDPVDGFNPWLWAQDLSAFIEDAEAWFAENPIGSDPKQDGKKAGQTIKKNIQEILQGSGSCTDGGSGTVASTTGETNAIIYAGSSDFGETFSEPVEINESTTFDQGSTRFSFRTTAYPTVAADAAGRIYVAWAARGFATIRNQPSDGDARIVVSTSTNGTVWTTPYAIDEPDRKGHQIKPSMLFAGGQLTLVYYDFRQDVSNIFEGFVIDLPEGDRLRHTVDVRVATALPAAMPEFTNYSLTASNEPVNPSNPASRYNFVAYGDESNVQTLQVEYMVPNFPMFADGTTPFIGDYVDVAAPNLINDGGNWRFASNPGDVQVWQAVWSDNRNVIPPPDGDWSKYVAPIAVSQPSLFDPTVIIPSCFDVTFPASDFPQGSLYTGTRNQNVYSASISNGVIVAAPGNNRPLAAGLQRGFVVYVQNTTGQAREFQLTLPTISGIDVSFAPNAPITTQNIEIPPYSSAVTTVFVTGNGATDAIQVAVAEVGGTLSGAVLLNSDSKAPGPLAASLLTAEVHNPAILNPAILNPAILNASVDATAEATCTGDDEKCVLNPAIFNPAILNPAILNPAIFNPAILNPAIFNPAILNPAIFNPAVLNPAIMNPAIMNPAILNPAILNPAIFNPAIFNPAILNPAVLNPAILNPAILNPAILNPAVLNPAILNPAVLNPAILNPAILNSAPEPSQVDVTFTVRNDGNATTAYDLSLAAPQLEGLDYELIVYRLNENPVAQGCVLTTEAQQQLIFNQTDPLNNAVDGSFYLEPGQEVLVTFRVLPDVDADTPADPVTTFVVDDLSGLVSAQPLNTDPLTQPPADQFGSAAIIVPGTAGGTTIGGGGTPPVTTGTLAIGEQVTVTATGFVRRGAGFALDTPNGSGACSANCLLPTADGLSLVARIGSGPWQFVGAGPTVLTATSAGDLEFGVNDNFFNDNSGSFYVTVSPYVPVAPILSSTFDSGTDDWTIANDGTPAWFNSGGNPGGYFSANDQGSGQYWFFRAPAQYEGNRSAFYGGELRYQLQQLSGFGSVSFPPWVVLAGGGLTLIYDGSAQGAPGNAWTSFAVPLDANSPGWYLAANNCWTGTGDSCGFTGATPPTPAEFQSVLANLDTLLIRGEYTIGPDSAGLDNVEITTGTGGQLVSLWRADGNAFDSVGDNDGTLQNGAGYATGRISQAFSLNGVNQHVLVADDPSLDITTELTMAAWIYPTGAGSHPSEGGIIVNKEWAYEVARFTDGTIRWATGNGVNSFAPLNAWVNSGVVAPLDTWTHVAVTYDQGVGKTYINGSEVHTFIIGTDNLGAGARPLRIGGREFHSQYFDGRIDEVGIYDTALAAADVQNLYNATAPFTQTVITGDSDILNDGTLIAANDLGGFPASVTVNGVDFGVDQAGPASGQWVVSGGNNFSIDALSLALDELLDDLIFVNFGRATVDSTFTINGLTAGRTYRLQMLLSNDLNSTSDNVEVTIEGATWLLNGWQPAPINLTAIFTATGSSVDIVMTRSATATTDEEGRGILNAYALHDVTP